MNWPWLPIGFMSRKIPYFWDSGVIRRMEARAARNGESMRKRYPHLAAEFDPLDREADEERRKSLLAALRKSWVPQE